ncbi:hypothetical protein HMI55_004090 [Coelomomyces lativittatus]|nr:hypothetical protein HMI55_004090 [Coelomomyces lativittatus]
MPVSANPWAVTPMTSDSPTENAAEASLKYRLQELHRRELELQIRESKLNEREEKIDEMVKRAPNWPACRPLVYHDIQKEIPEHGRMLVKKLYFTWCLSAWTYFFNCIASFACLITKSSAGGAQFGISFLIFLMGVPMSWSFWYQQVYVGVK